jgi:hypothetical protein
MTSPLNDKSGSPPGRRTRPGLASETGSKSLGSGNAIVAENSNSSRQPRGERGMLRGRWQRTLFRTPLIRDHVRVVLLGLAEEMRADAYVSYPLKDLAEKVGKSERVVLRCYATAVEVGLLARVTRGFPGHVATYRAQLPSPQRVTPGVTHTGSERVTPVVTHSEPERVSDKDTHSRSQGVTHSTLERVTPGAPQ